MDEKLITVTGRGGVHVVPDITRVNLTLESIHENYEEAYAQGKNDTARLAAIMKEVGLNKALPKTIYFNIDKKTENKYDKYRNYIGQEFIGFELDHRVKIDLGMDKVLLGKVIKLIGEQLRQAEIKIGFTVKDSRPSQLKMLERAVKDAKEKAEIMAAACGCKLGLVKDINYNVKELEIYSEARQIHGAQEAMCCNEDSLDISPDDLGVEDNVTVKWYLSNDLQNN